MFSCFFLFFFWKTDIEFSVPKMKGTTRLLSVTGAKANICHRGASVQMAWVTCTFVKVSLTILGL